MMSLKSVTSLQTPGNSQQLTDAQHPQNEWRRIRIRIQRVRGGGEVERIFWDDFFLEKRKFLPLTRFKTSTLTKAQLLYILKLILLYFTAVLNYLILFYYNIT